MNEAKRVAVFTNNKRDSDYSYLRKTVYTLLAAGAEVLADMRYRSCLGESRDGVKLCSYTEEMLAGADVAVVLGGDGSILEICEKTAAHNLPVFGINLGHLGYLTTIEKDDISKLSELVSGNYTVDERMMIDVRIIDKNVLHELRALNDVVIASGTRARIGCFSVKCDKNRAIGIKGDGVVIATPTGSTAYSLSAGGPVIDTRAELFCITPIAPHSLASRPIVVTADSVITASGCTLAPQTDIYIAADGRKGVSVSEHAMVEIKRSPLKTRLCRIGDDGFFDILTKKMHSI